MSIIRRRKPARSLVVKQLLILAMLPATLNEAEYWSAFYEQPLGYWMATLETIAARHDLAPCNWERAALGRNIVFLSRRYVLKLSPPCWAGDMAREAAALRFVAGRLPVASPRLVAEGTICGWDYLILERLPGTNLREIWSELEPAQRCALAAQHGRIMAAVHALPLCEAPALLGFDWAGLLLEQRTGCAAAMRQAGVQPALVMQVDHYLARAWPLLSDENDLVLLHGDLTHLNLLVVQAEPGWHICGLIDWGDVKIGPPTHEFISPGVHMYRGDGAALEQLYAGYGLHRGAASRELETVLMARSMLYYAEDFNYLLGVVQGTAACADWPAVARRFWRLGR